MFRSDAAVSTAGADVHGHGAVSHHTTSPDATPLPRAAVTALDEAGAGAWLKGLRLRSEQNDQCRIRGLNGLRVVSPGCPALPEL